jgi:hypothetical protein
MLTHSCELCAPASAKGRQVTSATVLPVRWDLGQAFMYLSTLACISCRTGLTVH